MTHTHHRPRRSNHQPTHNPKPDSMKTSMAGGIEPFITGTKVEVSSDEEGFRGAWFEATVVRTLPRLRSYTVEYDSLFSDDIGSKKLRETVGWTHVRRRPPNQCLDGFAVGEPVDAFYKDAWWTGVAAKVRRRRCLVFFPTTEEVIEFDEGEVRSHWEWVDGQWVDPRRKEKQQADAGINGSLLENHQAETGFSKGTPVEVSSDEEGFTGSWFMATIIEPRDDNMFLVEYNDLKTDDGKELLREAVNSVHIRPVPPDTKVTNFNLLEEVDAWYNDGWWVGVISKVLKASRYAVYFRQSNEELEFTHHDLRLHFDWSNGNWIRASQVLGFSLPSSYENGYSRASPEVLRKRFNC